MPELKETSPIFHSLPDEHYREGLNEAPRLKRIMRGLGRAATGTVVAAGNIMMVPLAATGLAATKGSEALWRSVDRVASLSGASAENPIRQYASESATNAHLAQRSIQNIGGRLIDGALDAVSRPNSAWNNRFANIGAKYAEQAKTAHDAGDYQKARTLMQEAEVNRSLHNSRQ